MEYKVEYDGVPIGLEIIGAIQMQNKCCEGRPILITKTRGLDVYSCQCACGGWCTDGYGNIYEAIAGYVKMNKETESCNVTDIYCKGGCSKCEHWDECYK
jgi:hypothetical protein